MKATRLAIKNFLSLSDVEITPGKVTQIVGANNSGKTSILKALEVALKGTTDGTVVKHGSDQAEIIVEFDNAIIAHRKIRSDGKQAVSVKKSGFSADKPQSMLTGLLSVGGFNPLELLDPKERANHLLKAIDLQVTESDLRLRVGAVSPVGIPPVDYAQHGLKVVEQAHRYYFQRRAEEKKALAAKEERLRVQTADTPPVPQEEPIDVEQVRLLIQEGRDRIAAEERKGAVAAERRQAVARVKSHLQTLISSRERLDNEIAMLRSKRLEVENQIKAQQKEVAAAEKNADSAAPDEAGIARARETIEGLQATLTRAAEIDAIAAKHKALDQIRADVEQTRGFVEKLEATVKLLGPDFRAELMKQTKLPIKGLTYENDQFYLDGCSIDNLSTSKAMRLAVSMARALAGPAKIICIDGAELLDEESYAAFRKEVEGDEFSYVLTCVGAGFASGPGDSVVKMVGGHAVAQ